MTLEKDVGLLQGEVKSLQKSFEGVEKKLDALEDSINSLNLTVQNTIAEGKGGWKVITVLAGVSVSFGAAISWLLSHIKWG